MAEGVVVDGVPVSVHERRDEQKQGGFGLVEVRDKDVHDAEGVSRADHDLRFGMQGVLTGGIKVIEDSLQSIVG